MKIVTLYRKAELSFKIKGDSSLPSTLSTIPVDLKSEWLIFLPYWA